MSSESASKRLKKTLTSSLAGVLGVQDLGGVVVEDEVLPGTTGEEVFSQWELEGCAVAKLLGRRGVTVVDETRRLIESLPAMEYARLKYYEKWICGSAALCLSAGIFEDRELERELGSDETPTEQTFEIGQSVIVRKETDHVRWRKPHLRTPGYVHGKRGTVVRAQGPFPAPETIAFATLRPKAAMAMLYTVRFKQVDLWDHYEASSVNDTLDCDVYSYWLRSIDDDNKNNEKVGLGWTKFGYGLASTHVPHNGHHLHESRQTAETKAVEDEAKHESPYALLLAAIVRLCVRKGIFTKDEVRSDAENLDAMAYGQTMEGARVIARAWTDETFKTKLLVDPKAAITETFPDIAETVKSRGGMGSTNTSSTKIAVKEDRDAVAQSFDFGHTDLVVVADTPSIHNVVVCTLCSCYPRALLGLPPRYFTSRAYRARVVAEPRTVLEDFGCKLPASVTTVRVHDSTAVRFFSLLFFLTLL